MNQQKGRENKLSSHHSQSRNTFTKRPLHIILDFDKTITDKDTIGLLAELAISSATDPNDVQQKWNHCLLKYTEDLEKHERHNPRPKVFSSQADIVTYEASLSTIEHASICRVNQSLIFAGATQSLITKGCQHALDEGLFHVRHGFRNFVEGLNARGGGSKWGVVSSNWSRSWICKTLETELGHDIEQQQDLIYSNEIDCTTGEIRGWIVEEDGTELYTHSSDEKYRAMSHMFMCWGSSGDPLKVYIGDSMNDVVCLLNADMGIIISPDGQDKLSALLRATGSPVQHMGHWKDIGEKTESIFWARDFEEVIVSGFLED